jgi:hypothetical protein
MERGLAWEAVVEGKGGRRWWRLRVREGEWDPIVGGRERRGGIVGFSRF